MYSNASTFRCKCALGISIPFENLFYFILLMSLSPTNIHELGILNFIKTKKKKNAQYQWAETQVLIFSPIEYKVTNLYHEDDHHTIDQRIKQIASHSSI